MIDRARRWRRGFTGAGLLMIFPVAYTIQPHLTDVYQSVCVFKTTSGYPCVFCGLTHAVAHATHGEWARAFEFHLFWWLAIVAIGCMAFLGLSDAMVGSDHLGRFARFVHANCVSFAGVLATLSVLRALYSAFLG